MNQFIARRAMAAKDETQFQAAQHMYSFRAEEYEQSWHPQYTDRFMEIVDVQPGEKILALACGTGLELAIAAPLVGEQGEVVGVDATAAMLDEARKKMAADPTMAQRVKLIQHDITNLSTCADISEGSFDTILCSNAFVLLDDPKQAVAHWKAYLKPSGKMVIDIAEEHNIPHGLMLEKAARRLGVSFPSNRTWVENINSFREILEGEELVVERVEKREKELGKGTRYFSMDEVDAKFDAITSFPLTDEIASEEFKVKARPLFREEWEAAAVDGKIEVTDTLYIYVARKA